MQYTVIVSNIGTVHESTDGAKARLDFISYRALSATGMGRAGNETVTLMGDGEIIEEHLPSKVKS
tara:strand:+ start:52 stop:246 length:195 start_codon:yes stop_codon:yes gene_type:complete